MTPTNSQMYMTKPKQVQKKLSENTGKTFFVIMPPFTSRGGHNYENDCTATSLFTLNSYILPFPNNSFTPRMSVAKKYNKFYEMSQNG